MAASPRRRTAVKLNSHEDPLRSLSPEGARLVSYHRIRKSFHWKTFRLHPYYILQSATRSPRRRDKVMGAVCWEMEDRGGAGSWLVVPPPEACSEGGLGETRPYGSWLVMALQGTGSWEWLSLCRPRYGNTGKTSQLRNNAPWWEETCYWWHYRAGGSVSRTSALCSSLRTKRENRCTCSSWFVLSGISISPRSLARNVRPSSSNVPSRTC